MVQQLARRAHAGLPAYALIADREGDILLGFESLIPLVTPHLHLVLCWYWRRICVGLSRGWALFRLAQGVGGRGAAQRSCRGRMMPRTAFMQGQGGAPHSLHAGAGVCPAQPSCRGWMTPPTAMQGQGDAPHAGAGGCPAQPSCS